MGAFHALAKRKARRIPRRARGTPARQPTCVPFRRPEPGSPRAPGGERLPARSHEGLANLFKPRLRGRREYALACVVLGVLRALLRRALWRTMAPFAGAVPFLARRENGYPGSTGGAQSQSDEQRYRPSVRHHALRSESGGDARDRSSDGEGRIAPVFAGGGVGTSAGIIFYAVSRRDTGGDGEPC